MSDGGGEERQAGVNPAHKKRHRHRKKQLHSSILKQMEFYFSDAALSKDRFLSQLMLKDPFIPIEIFLTFNKIKALTDKATDIAKALIESTLLTISEDGTKIKRTNPLVPYDVDSRTVYVESIPASADMKWITEVFQAHGPVAYISMPKYPKSNRIKGFAFVEFNTAADAEKCVKTFTTMGCKLPTSVKPEELSSCQGFQPETSETDEIKNENSDDVEKITFRERKDSEADELPPAKRFKTQSESSDVNCADTSLADSIPHENLADLSEGASEMENTGHPDDSEKKIKHTRKRKKKDRKKPHKDVDKRGLEGACKGLQVLSKVEWKVLRNKYLNLQRKHMKVLKQVLRTQHTLPENRGHFSRSTFAAEEQMEDNSQSAAPPSSEIPFIEGVIVAAKLTEPCTDIKELKQKTKANIHVKFVDVKEGSFDVYIRMDDSKAAKQMATSDIFPEARVLAGSEEKEYWEELRRQQTGRSSSKRKIRGRDRLIKKAQQYVNSAPPIPQMGKHIRFDE